MQSDVPGSMAQAVQWLLQLGQRSHAAQASPPRSEKPSSLCLAPEYELVTRHSLLEMVPHTVEMPCWRIGPAESHGWQPRHAHQCYDGNE